MKQTSVLVPIGLSAVVIAVYALRSPLQATGLMPFDPYYLVLFLLPILLILFKKFSFEDLGFRVGKPLMGIFFVFLLPVILYFRWSLMGRPIIAPTIFPFMLLIGSFAEELFFRGYLQEDFKKRFGGNIWISLVLSNIIFASVHLVKGYSLPSAAMTGLIGAYFGITKDNQGGNSLFYSMAAHGLYNLIAISVI
ncbi:CPBP family intramembrane metalloprotease [Candidatus Daviesbacteria bacterium]|nr:CPBP family intramembrane metalloprotease [Candidatus Daviesbacteria bacterium]